MTDVATTIFVSIRAVTFDHTLYFEFVIDYIMYFGYMCNLLAVLWQFGVMTSFYFTICSQCHKWMQICCKKRIEKQAETNKDAQTQMAKR